MPSGYIDTDRSKAITLGLSFSILLIVDFLKNCQIIDLNTVLSAVWLCENAVFHCFFHPLGGSRRAIRSL